MSDIFTVYCDESCHLENDHRTVMVLEAVWCPFDKIRVDQFIEEAARS